MGSKTFIGQLTWITCVLAIFFPLLAFTDCEETLARLSPNPSIHILVEGAGDVVERFYLPALAELKQEYQGRREVMATFTNYKRANESPAETEKRMRIRAAIEKAGFQYLEKTKAAEDKDYKAIVPDYIVLAAPGATTALVQSWQSRPLGPIRIFSEKPLETSLDRARFLLEIVPLGDGMMAMDHYRPKMQLTPEKVEAIESFLGGAIKQVDFTVTEDRSGSDKNTPLKGQTIERDGAIEREGRVDVMSGGVTEDLLPHVFAVLDYFGDSSTARPIKTWAGRYRGVDGDPNKPTEIPRETFFASDFVFKDHQGRLIDAHVTAGKGLRVRKYGEEVEQNTKVLELIGSNGNRVVFDLRGSGKGSSIATYFDKSGAVVKETPLEAKPYKAFFQGIVDGKSHTNELAFPVETGLAMREKLAQFLAPVLRQPALPLYDGGMGGQHFRPAPYTEDLIRTLPVLSGKMPQFTK